MAAATSDGMGPAVPVLSWIPAASDGIAARIATSFLSSGMNGETTAV